MTLKTSLFNKGIYKSTLKRCLWGSVLYFILIFLTTTLPIITDSSDYTIYTYESASRKIPYLLNYSGISFPMLLTIVVPTVAGLMIFRYMHSKKTSVFTHSLPASRNAIYISSVLAGFTLMALPVIANGLLLAITYASCFDMTLVLASLVWTAANLFGLFLMFSATCFVSSLTGNSFAMVALNVLVHVFLIAIVGTFNSMADQYLYGFTGTNEFFERILEGCFPAHIFIIIDNLSDWFVCKEAFEILPYIIATIGALIFYFFGWLLYKKRNLENAEDIAGFKVLNPIFKYLVTYLVAILSLSAPLGVITTVILSTVAYFGCEMLLKKTMKVWKSYKGFCVFAALFIILAVTFANTSFFGFETYCPDADNVESAIAYNSYYRHYATAAKPSFTDLALIEDITEIHRKILSDEYRYGENPRGGGDREPLHITYKMKNGSTVSRVYWIEKSDLDLMLRELYIYDEYKTNVLPLLYARDKGVLTYSDVHINAVNEIEQKIFNQDTCRELHEALCKDLLALDYDGIYKGDYAGVSVTIEAYVDGDEENHPQYEKDSMDIREGFTNTINWLKDNGYIE